MQHTFNVFGRMMTIVRAGDGWTCYWLGPEGKRRPAEISIPPDVTQGELGQYLYDIYHEDATPRNGDVLEIVAK
ncbi:DUF7661 family protein [Ralstonia pseudosolanacearum]|uniref:DUF7661 family protein n=1 Tax=Ralstonia pseudosolanacearum TaxID=1310165 RepID=UPI001868054D|nr:hypothetical protein [Ralstonia pseudosolanacearum]QOK93699.1 hypothetical protein HF908_19490 [Ralstonia pseudosolanacearum]UWD88480.1 hypothetical protein NY025_07270 [Ralstonia pseudosolanacearum]CAH0441559.1 hypothetical protein LMG9673_02362 [Ralstonia pseudosolanacearum]